MLHRIVPNKPGSEILLPGTSDLERLAIIMEPGENPAHGDLRKSVLLSELGAVHLLRIFRLSARMSRSVCNACGLAGPKRARDDAL